MSSGPQHYAEAERLLGEIGLGGDVLHEKRDAVPSWAPVYLAAAQAHATLALAAATALPLADAQEWQGVAG